jgi:hypothetical protein
MFALTFAAIFKTLKECWEWVVVDHDSNRLLATNVHESHSEAHSSKAPALSGCLRERRAPAPARVGSKDRCRVGSQAAINQVVKPRPLVVRPEGLRSDPASRGRKKKVHRISSREGALNVAVPYARMANLSRAKSKCKYQVVIVPM